MERDDDIVRRAELWATGATIHNVRQLISVYRAAASALDDHNRGDYNRAYAALLLPVAHKTLSEFIAHGDYDRVKRDNPLPSLPCDDS